MTQTLTTERLREIASSPSFSSSPLSHEVKYMARELLANREAQPVGYIMPDDVEHLKSGDVVVVVPNNSYCKFPLYTAPPAPAVPEKIGIQEAKELFNYLMTEEELNATVNGYNACRAAMLAAAPEGGNG